MEDRRAALRLVNYRCLFWIPELMHDEALILHVLHGRLTSDEGPMHSYEALHLTRRFAARR